MSSALLNVVDTDFKHVFNVKKGTTVLDLSNSNFPEVSEYITEAYKTEMNLFIKNYADKQPSKKFQENWKLESSIENNERINEMAKNIFIVEKTKELFGSPDLIIRYGILRGPPEVVINNQTILNKFELSEH